MPECCTYCGADSQIEREHVVSAAYLGIRTFDARKQWIVPACRTCNQLAGAKVFFSIPEKAEYILARYRRKYKKILSIPIWDTKELDDMGYLLRASVEAGVFAKAIIAQRVRFLESVTNYAHDYNRPDWVRREYEIWRKAQKRVYKKKKTKFEKDFARHA